MGSRNIAVLMAAGKGTRAGGGVPKQFMVVGGRMLLEYALHTFQRHPAIDGIAVVLPPGCQEAVRERLRQGYPKICAFAEGGDERFRSSWAAVQLFAGRAADNLLLHDAARPLLAPRTVSDIIGALRHCEAAVAAVPATDTVLHAGNDSLVTEVPARATLWYAQTPQGFRAGLLQRAFERHFRHPEISPTDESGLVHHYCPETDIRIVPGTADNFKVTYPADIARLRSVLRHESRV